MEWNPYTPGGEYLLMGDQVATYYQGLKFEGEYLMMEIQMTICNQGLDLKGMHHYDIYLLISNQAKLN